MKSVIKVQNLSKRYRLGLKEKQAETLVGQLANVIKSPWQNLKKLREMSRFGEENESVFWALKDINFEVKEGEVLGIIGKNGAGKSTLLKILSQITEPTTGKIEIHGRVASLLEVGTGFHPELSGRENIYMNGTILGMTRREIDSKLDEIIDFSGVEKFIDTPVKFYSSGMKVRLGFSVAAHLDPEILIIDEVLAVGDYEFQKKCLGKMEDVSKKEGRTVLFVSHNMPAVRELCPNSLLLESASVKMAGSTYEVMDYYLGGTKPSLNSSINLLNHPQKQNLNFGITKMEMICGGRMISEIMPLQSLEIKIYYQIEPHFLNVPIEVGFGLFDSSGSGVMAFNNKNFNREITLKTIAGSITVELPKFPIYKSGSLNITLYFGFLDQFYEILNDVACLRVRTNDFLGYGNPLNISLNQYALDNVVFDVEEII
jgi:lipopolysaccharide transport system ATP-binding protein